MRLYEFATDDISTLVHSTLLYLRPTGKDRATVQIDSLVQMLQNQGATVDRESLENLIDTDAMVGSLISGVGDDGVITWAQGTAKDDDDNAAPSDVAAPQDPDQEQMTPEQRLELMAQRASARQDSNQSRLGQMASKSMRS
jgi:hypothetical protein